MTFPEFLEVMHEHRKAEDLPREIVEAFRAADPMRRGYIPARQLRHMLLHWGECLSSREGRRLFPHWFTTIVVLKNVYIILISCNLLCFTTIVVLKNVY